MERAVVLRAAEEVAVDCVERNRQDFADADPLIGKRGIGVARRPSSLRHGRQVELVDATVVDVVEPTDPGASGARRPIQRVEHEVACIRVRPVGRLCRSLVDELPPAVVARGVQEDLAVAVVEAGVAGEEDVPEPFGDDREIVRRLPARVHLGLLVRIRECVADIDRRQ